jgi:hypothetical protein
LAFRRFAADQLKHEYGVELVNLFDTMPFSIVLSLCRFAADQLKHEYGVELVNVFDTMLADVVFCSWSSQPPALQKRARGYQAGLSPLSWIRIRIRPRNSSGSGPYLANFQIKDILQNLTAFSALLSLKINN